MSKEPNQNNKNKNTNVPPITITTATTPARLPAPAVQPSPACPLPPPGHARPCPALLRKNDILRTLHTFALPRPLLPGLCNGVQHLG
jgi:hypothetical protein